MRHEGERTIPAKTETVVTHVTCDLCGKRGHPDFGKGSKWSGLYYDVQQTEVSCEVGDHFPDTGRYTKTLSFDLCPECFVNKLVPWFEVQGARLTKSES